MKKGLMILMAALTLLLCACTQPADSTPPGDTDTVLSPTAEGTQPVSAISALPVDLPDPANWAAALHIDYTEYPRVDGSTATLPLAVYMRAKITGEPIADCLRKTAFTMTGQSYLELAAGNTDLLVVYEAPDEIKLQLEETGAEFIQKPIGLDALVFLTNEGNPVDSLTQQQIIDIYTGQITNWSAVGGEDKPIVAYQRISNSGSQALMLKLVMKDVPMMPAPESLQPGMMGELLDDIAAYENTGNALGYSVYYYVRNMYAVPGIKLLAVDGFAPCAETIAAGQYPYINPFYAVIRADEPEDSPARLLFNWLTGTEGARAVQDAGYVPAQA